MPEDSSQARAEPRRVEIVVSGATVLKAALVALGVVVLIVANEVFLTILLSLVFALGLDPLVGWFTGRGMGRGKAALLVFFLLFLAVFVIVVWAVTPLWNEIRGLVQDIPGYIDDLKDEPAFKQLADNTDAVDKAQKLAADAAAAIPKAASALLGLTGSLVGSVFSIVTLSFLTLFLLIGLPDFKRAGLKMLPPAEAQPGGAGARRGHADDLLLAAGEPRDLGDRRIGGGRDRRDHRCALPGGAGADRGAVRPDSPDRVADRGRDRGLDHACRRRVVPAAILAVVILIYQQVENYVIQPVVYRQAIELSGFATIAVVMVGGALMGVIGAILAVPVAGSLKVIFRELTAARRERMEALREQAASRA